MISMEPRPAATINVITRSGVMTHIQKMPNRPVEALVRKAPEKIPAFDIIREKETFLEAKKIFAGPSPPSAPAQPQSSPREASLDKVSILSTFFQSCLKLLRNQDALNELQNVIASCESLQSCDQDKMVHRVSRTGREMRLNAQIGAYDMTDVILDLGSDVNVLTKQTWEQMGKPTLA